jgi:nucleotide-binding universal stress UspA family protein
MKGLVIGVDGSDSSTTALRWAVEEAALHDWQATALLAWGYLDQHHADPGARFDPDYGEQDAAAALDAYVEQALGSEGAAEVGRRAVCDVAAPALIDAADGASLLVLGARGLGGFKGLLLGSVSLHCLHHARSPIAIVRTPPAPRTSEADMEQIIVGIDGSQASREALRWAAQEARLRQASLQVVMAWHTPYVTGYPYVAGAFDPALFEREARKTLDELVDELDTVGIPEVERVLGMGDAAVLLLTASKDADLLVVGSRGLGGFAGLMLGSVGHHLAHHATCPLVIVPPSA